MSKARPLSLPPSGLSVWRPLSSGEGGLVALLGSGHSEGEQSSGEDVQCVWCGLRSRPSAACEVCGSPLYESVGIWQEASVATVTPSAPTLTTSPPESGAPAEAKPRETAFKAFRRFAGLDIRWVTSTGD